MTGNPAWRLHSILERMINHTSYSETSTAREVIAAAWPLGIGIPEDSDYDEDSTLYHVFELQQLIHEVVRWIENRELDRELFKRPVERLWKGIMGVDPGSI